MVAPLVASTLLGGAIGAIGAHFDREAGEESQARQMAHQERMYKHRYQWQMQDMEAAGLNPILSYKQGAPTSGSVGGYTSDYAGGLSRGVGSALAAKRLNAEIDNIKADTALKNEQGTVATTQHQLNDIIARGNVMRNLMLEPEAFSARQLMELMERGGDAGEIAAGLNRLRRLLGIGSGQ